MDDWDNYLDNLGKIILSLKSLYNWDYRERDFLNHFYNYLIFPLCFEVEMVTSLKLKGSAEYSVQMYYAIVIILFELWDVSTYCTHHKPCYFSLICFSVSMVIMDWENGFKKDIFQDK